MEMFNSGINSDVCTEAQSSQDTPILELKHMRSQDKRIATPIQNAILSTTDTREPKNAYRQNIFQPLSSIITHISLVFVIRQWVQNFEPS